MEFLKFFRKQEEEDQKENLRHPVKSFTPPENADGANEVETTFDPRFGHMAAYTKFTGEFETKIRDTYELIRQYRSLSAIHEVDDAIQEIVDDSIVYEESKEVAWLDLDSTTFSEAIKDKIDDEFEYISSLLKIRKQAHQLFRSWYVDSRIYFHKILNDDGTIRELRRLDPLKIELIREIQRSREDGVDIVVGVHEYYIYRQGDRNTYAAGFNTHGSLQELRIPKDAIVFAFSGLVDQCSDNKNVIGYLHRAIKPANQLKMLEDALVIYRLTRAPERRVFYIDVGNMPNRKAQQYVNNIMQGLKNRVVYDTTTGKVKNTNSNLSMLEDYYLPRREGSKGTEVTTLPPGQNLGDIEDILYFNKKLYKAMHIPASRAAADDQQGGINFGGGSEITRDELKFTKFIRRLQNRFEPVFMDPLKHQLMVKNIITEEEWEENIEKMYVVFHKDSYYEERKDLEIMTSRLQALEQASPYIGKYMSHTYAMKNILRMSDDEIKESDKQITDELKDPKFKVEEPEF